MMRRWRRQTLRRWTIWFSEYVIYNQILHDNVCSQIVRTGSEIDCTVTEIHFEVTLYRLIKYPPQQSARKWCLRATPATLFIRSSSRGRKCLGSVPSGY
jgi:hypothetical protein